jgi:hypothetical protein
LADKRAQINAYKSSLTPTIAAELQSKMPWGRNGGGGRRRSGGGGTTGNNTPTSIDNNAQLISSITSDNINNNQPVMNIT